MLYKSRGIEFECDVDIDEAEADAYIKRALTMHGGDRIRKINAHVDGDFVELSYTTFRIPFQRIRRIRGYLVGTMDRWNDAKTAEEQDRVKHSVTCTDGRGEEDGAGEE